MATILILGGYGYTGKFLAKHILAHTEADIIIAGRTIEKAQAFVNELHNPRASARQADASDYKNLSQALLGATLCLVAAPTTHQVHTVIRACIDAGGDSKGRFMLYYRSGLSPRLASCAHSLRRNKTGHTRIGSHSRLPQYARVAVHRSRG